MGIFAVGAWCIRQAWAAAPRMVAAAAVLGLLVAAVPSLQVVLMAQFVGALTGADSFDDVAAPFAGLVLLIAFTGPVEAIAGTMQWRVVDLLGLHSKREVADTLATLPPTVLADPVAAADIEAGNKAAEEELSFLYPFVLSLLRDILSVVGVFLTLATMSPLAAVFVLISLLPMLFASQRISRISSRMWDDVGKLYWRSRYLHQHLVTTASSIELTSLGANGQISSKVTGTVGQITARKSQTYLPMLSWRLLAGAATSLLLAGALAALVVGVHYGPAAAGGVYGVMAAMGAVGSLGANLGNIVEGSAPYERYEKLLGMRREARDPSLARDARSLVVSGISHTYEGQDAASLVGLDLRIDKGRIVALVGVNGAGKTTAVNSIVGTLDPQFGEISIDGRTRADMPFQEWVGHFGTLTQEFGRYELTVRESLQLGTPRRDVSDEEMWTALEAANAAHMVRGFENGLDQQLGSQWDGGVGLSGGQWQRISLARIHLRAAPIWILDEPTSAIDAEAEQDIFRELQRSKADRITIVVSHRAWTLRGMDEILVVDQGRVIERGRYDELLGRGGRFTEIFAEQAA
ncbi:MAG: ABC transporter ATP-binding protein/permease [Brachybacterium sp.]|uniref:ABC transporter ATP-binding protein n=1 Tax=Brachybacterium sp. TaxID=1891286 RepID=UPI0026490101|nr:ABC transporter ATP-binding protein [Brachybacterium sp.]MDN5688615.1 ABC transporter ATP-binding protein/permease [Brachybacterium sp.]